MVIGVVEIVDLKTFYLRRENYAFDTLCYTTSQLTDTCSSGIRMLGRGAILLWTCSRGAWLLRPPITPSHSTAASE